MLQLFSKVCCYFRSKNVFSMIKKLSKTEKYKQRPLKTALHLWRGSRSPAGKAVTPLMFSLHPRRVSRVIRLDRERTLAVLTEPSGKSKLEPWPADPVSWVRIRHYLSEDGSGDRHRTVKENQ